MEFNSANIRNWSLIGENGIVGTILSELILKDHKLIVLTADQSFVSGLSRFKKKYPNRFFNVGIAEQNMINIAAGLYKEGFNAVVTAQAPFIAMRSTDQVRISLGYMKLGVKLIGLSSGFSQGEYGATHHCINDIAIMRSIPNLTIISPADTTETAKAILAFANNDSPIYLRLTGTSRMPLVYKEDYNFEIGKSIVLHEGEDITIFATGSMVYYALNLVSLFSDKGISVKIVNMHTIKPLDKKAVLDACTSKLIVTMEEHSIIGGLGGAVAEILSSLKNHPPLEIIGTNDHYSYANPHAILLNKEGLTTEFVFERILKKYYE